MKSNFPSYYTFRNRDDQTFQLRGDLTMEDLVRMGYGDIRLVHPETPLKPHEWRCDPPPNPPPSNQKRVLPPQKIQTNGHS